MSLVSCACKLLVHWRGGGRSGRGLLLGPALPSHFLLLLLCGAACFVCPSALHALLAPLECNVRMAFLFALSWACADGLRHTVCFGTQFVLDVIG